MSNCVAAIQFDKEKQRFVLVSGSNRVEIRKTKALTKFVKDAPDISVDILAGLKDVWFEDAEFEEVEEDGVYEDTHEDIEQDEEVLDHAM